MGRTWRDVVDGGADWSCEAADAVEWLTGLPDDSIDLLFTSPPYEFARAYGMAERMVGGQAWVDWLVSVVRAAAPKVRGLIAVNCEGQTRNYAYSGVPYLLFADLHRAGFNMRRPVVYHRIGIPGSGGPDWLRGDTEPVICLTRPGRLPWSDPTACGHPPKWAPGGEMSHRLTDGTRRNQWGMNTTQNRRRPDGDRQAMTAPSHVLYTKAAKLALGAKRHTKRDASPQANGEALREQAYLPPAVANPGNVVVERYTADEVTALLGVAGDLTHHTVGGGQMGCGIAHENEAPFPLTLAEFFVKSFCPPGGIVLDCFSGSGTTAHAAILHGRRFVGCDLRQSQVDLCGRRLATVTPSLFAAAPPEPAPACAAPPAARSLFDGVGDA